MHRSFAMFVSLAILVGFGDFAEAQDGFADDLTIPEDIEVAEVSAVSRLGTPTGKDAFREAILALVKKNEGGDDSNVKATLRDIDLVYREMRPRLERYLATSPSWRVFEVRGQRFATRRWKMPPDWRYEMHGYYSKFDVGIRRPDLKNLPDFQTRLTLGLTGKPWAASWTASRLKNGKEEVVKLKNADKKPTSHCVIEVGELIVEVFEQTEIKERRITKQSLDLLEKEFLGVVDAAEWPDVIKLLPDGSIRKEKPGIELLAAFSPGIYDSVIWANPGEPGMVYLRAFEVTKEHELSKPRLKRYSNERIGWSNDPTEQFFSNTHFTIYEGDWGKPYAARFEVWFIPDSGKPERKLLERVFKIEGWQR